MHSKHMKYEKFFINRKFFSPCPGYKSKNPFRDTFATQKCRKSEKWVFDRDSVFRPKKHVVVTIFNQERDKKLLKTFFDEKKLIFIKKN